MQITFPMSREAVNALRKEAFQIDPFFTFPNYCLIDEEGKIVLNKAPHPGSKELEKLLAKLLQPQK